jgi:hypothetical protein
MFTNPDKKSTDTIWKKISTNTDQKKLKYEKISSSLKYLEGSSNSKQFELSKERKQRGISKKRNDEIDAIQSDPFKNILKTETKNYDISLTSRQKPAKPQN